MAEVAVCVNLGALVAGMVLCSQNLAVSLVAFVITAFGK
jgi:hypothetical protein